MEKKIKSVKLKTNGLIIPTLKFRESDRHWYLNDLQWSEENILSGRLNDLFEIEYEPERKFIDVRIEYDNSSETIIVDERNLQTHFEIKTDLKNIKVTELPEVFTREDMEGLARWVEGRDDKDKDRFKNIVDNFMRDRTSERESL